MDGVDLVGDRAIGLQARHRPPRRRDCRPRPRRYRPLAPSRRAACGTRPAFKRAADLQGSSFSASGAAMPNEPGPSSGTGVRRAGKRVGVVDVDVYNEQKALVRSAGRHTRHCRLGPIAIVCLAGARRQCTGRSTIYRPTGAGRSPCLLPSLCPWCRPPRWSGSRSGGRWQHRQTR